MEKTSPIETECHQVSSQVAAEWGQHSFLTPHWELFSLDHSILLSRFPWASPILIWEHTHNNQQCPPKSGTITECLLYFRGWTKPCHTGSPLMLMVILQERHYPRFTYAECHSAGEWHSWHSDPDWSDVKGFIFLLYHTTAFWKS